MDVEHNPDGSLKIRSDGSVLGMADSEQIIDVPAGMTDTHVYSRATRSPKDGYWHVTSFIAYSE